MQKTRHAARKLTAAYEKALKAVDLTGGQFSILVAVGFKGPVPITPLADGLGMDRTTLTRGIAPLERRGLLRAVHHGADSRIRLIEITAKGADLLDKAIPLWESAQSNAVAALSEDEFAMLHDGLRSISGD